MSDKIIESDETNIAEFNSTIETLDAVINGLRNLSATVNEFDESFPVTAVTAFSKRPLVGQVREWAALIANAMYRTDSREVKHWDDMSIAQQALMTAGIRGLIDGGYCIVPQELVQYALGAAKKIEHFETNAKKPPT